MDSGQLRVRVALPSKRAGWLVEMIPLDAVATIRAEEIALDAITVDLNRQEMRLPRPIVSTAAEHRQVLVWLE